MRKNTRTIWAGAVAAACVAIALVCLANLVPGNDARQAPPRPFVVHEWGTFTSFAGSDGVNLEFRPLVTNDLPRFVKNPLSQLGFPELSKDSYVALQRMETPVTYFYTDTPRVVNVRVDFPQGMLTEWYPVVREFESGKATDTRPMGRAYLDWGAVRLTPAKQFANIRMRNAKGQAVPASLPPVRERDHYGRARETDSAIVETVDKNRASHFEKFLFYRGLGNFELPIKLVALGNSGFEVTNTSIDASGALLLVRIENDRVRFIRMEPISAGHTVEVKLPSDEPGVDQLAEATVAELTAAGLYEKESRAMVNTWRNSWFGENGTRLLYLVPDKLTDTLLPLSIEPVPDQQVRILVGRLETLTPEDCQRLVRTLAGSGAADASSSERIESELKTLGRFAEPAIKSAINQTNDEGMRERLEEVLTKVRGKK